MIDIYGILPSLEFFPGLATTCLEGGFFHGPSRPGIKAPFEAIIK